MRLRACALILALSSAACAGTEPGAQFAAEGPGAIEVDGSGAPINPYGAYLSGRVAQDEHDYAAALAFYQDALAHAPGDLEVSNRLFVLAATMGRFDLAAPLAQKLVAANPNASLANVIVAVEALKRDRPHTALEAADRIPNEGYFRLCGALVRAWATLAATNQLSAATAALDDLGTEAPLRSLKSLQRALLADVAGDRSAAGDAYRAAIDDGAPAFRMVQLAGNFFERNGASAEAARLYVSYDAAAHGEAGDALRAPTPGKIPPPLVPNAAAGLAEAMFDLASLLSQAGSPDVAILNARLSLELRPDAPLTELVLGDALQADDQPKAALQAYQRVDLGSPFAWTARLRKAEVADALGNVAAAEQTLKIMATERPSQADAPFALGAVLREHDDDKAAIAAYSEGLDRLGPKPPARYWSIFYSRGIAEEESGSWPAAETDLRRALELDPNNADVLNFLGYSLVERDEDLPEALLLIKRAVDLQPDNGYILDSLGWAYYQSGKTEDAERTLEKAVELKPGDAEINDHLGDAYWQGGRRAEARLQWHRALSLKPEPGVAQKIEAKLDHPPPQPRRMKTAREPY